MAALDVAVNENLAENAERMGQIFRDKINEYIPNSRITQKVRGRGLLNAVVINDTEDSSTAWDICMALRDKGLLAKPTHGNIIRFAPPLVITEKELLECVAIIVETLKQFE
jgi:ornithine--oxo-acid transaminase